MVEVVKSHDFILASFEVDLVKVGLDVLVLLGKSVDNIFFKGIETHFNILKLADRKPFNPLKLDFEEIDCF